MAARDLICIWHSTASRGRFISHQILVNFFFQWKSAARWQHVKLTPDGSRRQAAALETMMKRIKLKLFFFLGFFFFWRLTIGAIVRETKFANRRLCPLADVTQHPALRGRRRRFRPASRPSSRRLWRTSRGSQRPAASNPVKEKIKNLKCFLNSIEFNSPLYIKFKFSFKETEGAVRRFNGATLCLQRG